MGFPDHNTGLWLVAIADRAQIWGCSLTFISVILCSPQAATDDTARFVRMDFVRSLHDGAVLPDSFPRGTYRDCDLVLIPVTTYYRKVFQV